MSSRNRQSPWRRFVIPLLLGFVGVMTWLLIALPTFKDAPLARRSQAVPDQSKDRLENSETARAKDSPPDAVEFPKESRKAKILALVRSEALRVGKIDRNPEQTYKDVEAKARTLPRGDLAILSSIALNPKLQNDLRFTSVFLLSLSRNKASLPALERVALASIPSDLPINSPLYTEELVIRMQAIEGLRRFQTKGKKSGPLVDYIKRQKNTFLADHARRHL